MFSGRGGGGVDGGGVALCWAAPWSREHLLPSRKGDASVPSPHNPSPAPTGSKALPRRCHTIPTPKIHPLYMGQQQKMRLRDYGQCKVKAAALTGYACTLYLYQGRRGMSYACTSRRQVRTTATTAKMTA